MNSSELPTNRHGRVFRRAFTHPFIARGVLIFGLLALTGRPCFSAVVIFPRTGEEFDDAGSWQKQASWLGNPSPTAHITVENGVACFAVDEPLRGMKWTRPLQVYLPSHPFLVVRYRAHNLRKMDDYFIWINDGHPGECRPILLSQLVVDGKWHTVAVDASAIARAPSIHDIAVQVQATKAGKARVWIDYIRFAETPPEGALKVGPSGKLAKKDWIVDLRKNRWERHPDWLSNPAKDTNVSADSEGVHFSVGTAFLGMKWSLPLRENIKTSAYRFLVLRYQAKNLSSRGDYALCVIGSPHGNGMDYVPIVHAAQLMADGRWHTLAANLGPALGKLETIGAIAAQVQAAGAKEPATLTLADVRFSARKPMVNLATDFDLREGADFRGFEPVDIAGLCNENAERVLRHLNLSGWPKTDTISVSGVPFRLVQKASNAYFSPLKGYADLRIPVKGQGSQVFVLLAAALVGPEEPARGEGKLRAIRDVDRFRVSVQYADGQVDEMLPLNVSAGRYEISSGLQVLSLFTDRTRTLRSITIHDLCDQAAFGVVAVTRNVQNKPLFTDLRERFAPIRYKRNPQALAVTGRWTLKLAGDVALFESSVGTWRIALKPLPRVTHAKTVVGELSFVSEPSALFSVTLDGKDVTDAFKLQKASCVENGKNTLRLLYETYGGPRVRVSAQVSLSKQSELTFAISAKNLDQKAHRLRLVAPRIGPFRLGEKSEDDYYFLPCRGAIFNNVDRMFEQRYCGLFPLQFMSLTDPAAGVGAYLRTEDTNDVRRHYRMEKTAEGTTFAIVYPDPGQVQPGATVGGILTRVGITDGDPRRGLAVYKKWLKTWYRPAAPRKQWFREVFNFRQSFLHSLDPLYNAKTGTFHLDRAIDEAKKQFGGIEYLHLFDWGNCGPYGRIYGRTGDYSPYDYLKGGRKAFHDAIQSVRKKGIRVGLYIEGYLLQEKGKLGQAHGRDWQLIRADGSRAYWPGSTEMFICPAVAAWREVQASTYATKVRELDVDGMYIDEFGFAGPSKDCYCPNHGHPVPSYAVVAERGMTQMIRERVDQVKPGVAIYTEESPCDVNSQYQDGSFTYAMSAAKWTGSLVPINIVRFAIPSFKTIEILKCDKPTGTWATGVKWVFFNGEGIWLEGPATKWFAPQTRAAIRKCHAILRAHRDAFTTDDPEPLVQTEMPGVFANYFPAKSEQVYTLYNAHHSTVRGAILRIPHRAGCRYIDAWSGQPIKVRRDGEYDILSFAIEPMGVGCVVCKPGEK